MITTLAWKDYREHLPVWAAMAALAAFLIVILSQVFAPHGLAGAPAEKLQILALAALIVTVSYGLICGAMMVAGETEARTQTFLDMLPAGRMRLWITKLFMGVLFTLAYALVVTGIVVILGLADVKALPVGWQLALPLVGVEAFVYGLLGSVLGRSVLGACGWALLPLAVGWIMGGEPDWPPGAHLLTIRGILALCILGVAGLIFCRHDLLRAGGCVPAQDRRLRSGDGGRASTQETTWKIEDEEKRIPRYSSSVLYSESWRMLSWLAWRQGWPRFLLLSVVSFAAGLLLPNAGLAIWPVASLLIGIVFGTGMFSGEQPEEAYRFLGGQRLPPSQVWLGKVIGWSAMAVGVLGFMILGAILHLASEHMPPGSTARASGYGHLLGSPLLLDVLPKEVFLLLWPVYGFVIGQLLALLCRKSVVALVLSILVSVPIVGIWIPSLIVGGLKFWQILPAAVLLVIATRLGLWAWAAGLLKNGRSAFGLLACACLAGAWLAGNLVYRVVEIPDLGEPFDVRSFLAGLPTPEQNRAGSLIRRAARELMEQQRFAVENRQRTEDAAQAAGGGPAGAAAMQPGIPPPQGLEALVPPDAQASGIPPAPPDTAPAIAPRQASLSDDERVSRLLQEGWPDDDAELKLWLDPLCQGEWIDHLRQAATLPLGVVEDPRLLSGSIQLQDKPVYVFAAELLVARALQIQAAGDPASALDHLFWTLALSRHLRYASTEISYYYGQRVEAIALLGLDRWLDRLGRNLRRGPELVQRALQELNRHETETPPATEPIRAEYCALRDRPNDAVRWLFTGAHYSAPANLERDLVTLALQTPWERERARRFLNALTISRLKEAQTPYWQLPLQARLVNRNSVPIPFDEPWLVNFLPDGNHRSMGFEQWEHLLSDSPLLHRLFVLSLRHEPLGEASSLCRVRAARLKLALTLYQIQERKPAQRLKQLVPRYLEELPLDPFSGGPFRYSDSIVQLKGPDGEVLGMGQGILQSVGPDGPGGPTPGGGSFIVPSWPR
jgi:hypothetical protein